MHACAGDMLASFLLHLAIVLLLILFAPSPLNVPHPSAKHAPDRNRILLQPAPSPSKGGGGSRSPLPPSKGRLPRYAHQQFVPVMIRPVVIEPKLAMEPTITVRLATELPTSALIGAPTGVPGPPSGGSGGPFGIGGDRNGGIGEDVGSGVGTIVAQPLSAASNPPVPIYKLEPEYSDQARKARIQGTVVLEGIIDERGLTHALKVRDGLGYGLDEQAIQAVKLWRFKPAMKDGRPLAIQGVFFLTFRLL